MSANPKRPQPSNTAITCGGCGSANVVYSHDKGFRCEDCGQHD